MRTVKVRLLLLCLVLLLTGGCGRGDQSSNTGHSVIIPSADGKETLEAENLLIDISHLDRGYFMVCYTGTSDKLYVQLVGPDQVEYKYFCKPSQEYTTIPLTTGDGEYYLCAYENIGADQYSPIFSRTLTVKLENEFDPFLCSSQYVSFTMDSATVARGEELTQGMTDPLEEVQAVYDWVTKNVEYDYDKAVNVNQGYLPDVDETLETKKGICFDYAALMITMLRSQGIPSKLNIGYLTEDVYHAWISVWLDEKGWVDNVIQFDGKNWQLLDPTVASSSNSQKVENLMSDEKNYIVRYVR
ncbi:MAG: transglutaminase-like domain-containing protein [Lachnospiraceae bacterium]|nr:transglutaminase-like domain-containing protein [Lachnospiraceae bacterium]